MEMFTFAHALRDHPHATYKLLFNGLYYGSAKPAQLP